MRYMNIDNLVKIRKKEVVREMLKISKLTSTMWKHCLRGKHARNKFRSKEYSTKTPLEIVHTNLCGTMRKKGLNDKQYFMLIIDDYTRMTAMSFLKNKLEEFINFKIFKEMVEKKMDWRIKCLRSNNGGEFISKEFI
jgi:hypothetical protein